MGRLGLVGRLGQKEANSPSETINYQPLLFRPLPLLFFPLRPLCFNRFSCLQHSVQHTGDAGRHAAGDHASEHCSQTELSQIAPAFGGQRTNAANLNTN
jgi:hypothetical protein